ncbi:MAG TPA: hypothetical protein VMV35_07615 [Halothiobacillus sp.]|nr:hypothetical protein [Halothiobacillus sp.]
MKTFFSIAGGIFLVIVVLGAGFVGYGMYQGRDLDASSKAYVEANVPVVLSTWSEDELLKRSAPQLLSVLQTQPEQLHQVFQKLSALGALRRFYDVKGEANMAYTLKNGLVVTASYVAQAKFEHGDGHVTIRLIRLSGAWKLLMLNVNSPLFLQ